MHKEYGRFKKIRLHDIYHKILFNYLEVELKKCLDCDKSDFSQNLDPRRTWSGFSRGTGLVSLDYTLKEGANEFRLELQLQSDHLKLMLTHPNKEVLPKKDIDEFFDIISNLAKNSKYCKDGKLFPIFPNRKNKEYNVYGKNLIYKNIRLKETLNFKDIIKMLYDTFKKIIEFAQKEEKNI